MTNDEMANHAARTPCGFVALVNPISGRGAAVAKWAPIADALRDRGHEVEVEATRDAAHATGAASEATRAGKTAVAVGGDGLVRDVAAGVVPTGGTMAIVPAGRGNDLAGLLGIPADENALVQMLASGSTRLIDVLEVNGALVPGNVYVGVDSLAARYINRNRRLPALALYRGAGLAAAARWKRTEFTLTYTCATQHDDDHPTSVGEEVTRVVRAHDIVVANSGRYGNGLRIVPGAALDDGIIDVLIVRHGSPLRVLSMMIAARSGRHVGRDDVDVLRVTQLRIEADRDVPFGADGDEVTTLPADVGIRPRALSIIIPQR